MRASDPPIDTEKVDAVGFTAEHPLPDDVVRELVRFRLAEIDAGRH